MKLIAICGADGTELSGSEFSQAKAVLEGAQSKIPKWRVTNTGHYGGISQTEINRFLEGLLATSPEEDRATMKAKLMDPQMYAMMLATIGTQWQEWVGLFAGMKLPSGDNSTVQREQMDLFGIRVPSKIKIDRWPRYMDRGVECVDVIFEQTVNDKAFRRALHKLAERIAPTELPPIQSASTSLEIYSVFEVDTLRPHDVLVDKVKRFKSEGKTQVEVESSWYVFEWEDIDPFDWEADQGTIDSLLQALQDEFQRDD